MNALKLTASFFAFVVMGVFLGCQGPAISHSNKLSHSTSHNGIFLSVSFDSEVKLDPIARVELINKSKYPIRCFFAYNAHPDIELKLRSKDGSLVESTPEGMRIAHRGAAGYSPLSIVYVVPNSSQWWNVHLSNYFVLPKDGCFLDIEFPVNASYSEIHQSRRDGKSIPATPENRNLNADGFMLKLTNLPLIRKQ